MRIGRMRIDPTLSTLFALDVIVHAIGLLLLDGVQREVLATEALIHIPLLGAALAMIGWGDAR